MTNARSDQTGECARARELLSEALAEQAGLAERMGLAAGPEELSAEIPEGRAFLETHVAGCSDCAAFAAQQRALDARLAAMLASPAPVLSAGFRPALRVRLRGEQHAAARQRRRAWLDALPDLVHFTSCGVAITACAVALPSSAAFILSCGTVIALATYVPLLVLKNSFEDVERMSGATR